MMISAQNLSQLPNVCAIYRVLHQERIIYVGQAGNLNQRWKNHHLLSQLIANYGLEWYIDWVEVAPENLNRAEAFAHRQFQPELNRCNPSQNLGDPIWQTFTLPEPGLPTR
jgi:excinuclease UvrABC nuclease subunit